MRDFGKFTTLRTYWDGPYCIFEIQYGGGVSVRNNSNFQYSFTPKRRDTKDLEGELQVVFANSALEEGLIREDEEFDSCEELFKVASERHVLREMDTATLEVGDDEEFDKI